MDKVTVYTTKYCPYCMRAKALLKQKGQPFDEMAVDGKPQLRAEIAQKSGQTSVPQIWIGDKHIGGCDDLFQLEASGELDKLLPN